MKPAAEHSDDPRGRPLLPGELGFAPSRVYLGLPYTYFADWNCLWP